MTSRIFEWDEAKNLANQRKHDGIGFLEASQVFSDPLHVSYVDRVEGGEQRWRTLGITNGFVLLVVAHTTTELDEDGEEIELVRIISARRTDRSERKRYENENRQI